MRNSECEVNSQSPKCSLWTITVNHWTWLQTWDTALHLQTSSNFQSQSNMPWFLWDAPWWSWNQHHNQLWLELQPLGISQVDMCPKRNQWSEYLQRSSCQRHLFQEKILGVQCKSHARSKVWQKKHNPKSSIQSPNPKSKFRNPKTNIQNELLY